MAIPEFAQPVASEEKGKGCNKTDAFRARGSLDLDGKWVCYFLSSHNSTKSGGIDWRFPPGGWT